MSDELLFESIKKNILRDINDIRLYISAIRWLIITGDLVIKDEEGEKMLNAIIKKHLYEILEKIADMEVGIGILKALMKKWQANTK